MRYLSGNIPSKYADTDLDTVPEPWREHLAKEVESGNFLIGGKSLLLSGPGAEAAARQWIAALRIGNFQAYRTTLLEVYQRVEQKVPLFDNEQRRAEFEEADCVLIDRFFTDPQMPEDRMYAVTWYIADLLENGVVFLLASDDPDPALDFHGPHLADTIIQHFEVIDGKTTDQKATRTSKGIKRKRKIGGNVSAGGGTE